MGTPEFAAKSLRGLYNAGHDIACVFTQADKPKNRGMKMSISAVKEVAISENTPVYQPLTLKDGVAADIIRSFTCDILVMSSITELIALRKLNGLDM